MSSGKTRSNTRWKKGVSKAEAVSTELTTNLPSASMAGLRLPALSSTIWSITDRPSSADLSRMGRVKTPISGGEQVKPPPAEAGGFRDQGVTKPVNRRVGVMSRVARCDHNTSLQPYAVPCFLLSRVSMPAQDDDTQTTQRKPLANHRPQAIAALSRGA